MGLLNALVRRAKAKRRDWTTYVLAEGNGVDLTQPEAKPEDRPQPDVVFNAEPTGVFKTEGRLISMSPREQWPALHLPGAGTDALKGVSAVHVAVHQMNYQGLVRRPIILFDFRAAPNEISDSLPWIVPPPAKAGK